MPLLTITITTAYSTSTRTQHLMSYILYDRLPNKLHTSKSGASTLSRLCDACTWRVSCTAIRSTVHHSHTLSSGIASGWEQRFMPCSHSCRSSLLLATNRAPIMCFLLTGNARCLVTCCPAAGLSIEKGQGRRTCCSLLCCLLVFHSWSGRPPFFSLLLIYLSRVTFIPPRTIEQTLRLPSHDHRLNCPRPAMPQLPPSTRPQHQTPKPCLRNQNT
jgi:hypothetical protein